MNSIEFLLLFVVTVSFVSLMANSLLDEKANIEQTKAGIDEILKTRQAARTVEIWLNAGRISNLHFRDENISFRIEDDSFLVRYEGKIIEVEGVFEDEKREPM